LGGTARLEEVAAAAAESAPEKTSRTPSSAGMDARSRSTAERRTSSGGIICPRCGWEEEADAKFCSLCLRRFNKTDKLDVRVLSTMENPVENPLALEDAMGPRTPAWAARPLQRPALAAVAVAAVVVLVILAVFLR